MKALAPDLKDRYTTCEELRHDLAKFLAQTSPATDATRVAKFLGELYDQDIAAERAEREQVIVRAREWYAVTYPRPSAKSSSANTAPIAGDKKPAADKFEADTEERPMRETVLSIPMRFDKARAALGSSDPAAPPKIPNPPTTAERALDPSGGSLSNAVIGSVVGGRYYVRRLCGEGGMGRVYEAEHIDIGRRVALKILHPAYSQTPDLVERLRREARAASKISHPNVVDVTDSGTTPDGAFFFVMEYLEGIELGELIYRQGKLDVARTLHVGAQICRALQAAHEVNVIHRDLKPENVLILNRDGQPDFVKVLDFGIAKSGSDGDFENEKDTNGDVRRRLTHPGMTMGTPEYMAPEQAAGKPADPRSDIYAVGGLLYEMLSGKAPYEGSNFMEILHKKANTMPAALSTFRDRRAARAGGADHARAGARPGRPAALDGRDGARADQPRQHAVPRVRRWRRSSSPRSFRKPACWARCGAVRRRPAASTSGCARRCGTRRSRWARAGRWCSSSRTWSPARRCTGVMRTTRSRP